MQDAPGSGASSVQFSHPGVQRAPYATPAGLKKLRVAAEKPRITLRNLESHVMTEDDIPQVVLQKLESQSKRERA